ncbi:MAG TPA: hemolysin family protein, partial [Syntrophales bacterium]|nr:hemolysin family protein [Syntrophales bacterium]
MDFPIPFRIVFLLFLILLSGFFSGSEASLFYLSPLHLHKMGEDGNPFTLFVRRLLARPRRLLVSILVGNEAVNITIAVISTSLFLTYFGAEGKWISIAVTTSVILVFGEALPKVFAVNYPIRYSSFVSLPLTLFSLLIRPAVWFLEKISDLFVYLFGKTVTAPPASVMEKEFISLVDAGHREGALQETQKRMIHRVFELSDITVEEIMIPRVDMFCLPASMDGGEMAREMIRARFSQAPVCGTDRDDILGIVHARDILAEMLRGKKTFSIRKLLKKPYFVPLERSAENVMRDLQIRKIQMAIAVDEFGGIEGLVT